MSTPSLTAPRITLVDQVFARRLPMDAVLVASGAALTALAAQVAVPLWPVPITGQTLAVLLVGSSLGAVRGGLSMVLYALLGLVGLPVFSDAASGAHVLLGPTGGYIVGFIPAAALTGWLAQRRWDRRFWRALASFAAGSLVTFAIGLPWLAIALGLDLEQTLEGGLYPFILGGVVKAVIAAGLLPLAWRAVERADARRGS